jgi:hypothetical protein
MKESVWAKNVLLFGLVFVGVGFVSLVMLSSDRIERPESFHPRSESERSISDVATQIDVAFENHWQSLGLTPTDQASGLLIARRLSLGLAGTIPSMEEIREFEKQPAEHQIHWWVSRLLEDKRTSNHIAERLARALVGVDEGPFLVFRRRRFVSWLSDQLEAKVNYDHLVRTILTDEGLWTDTPAVNFYTRTLAEDNESQPDPVLLAGRTTRAFLGMRIDCLQCHDDFLGTINLGSPDDLKAGMQSDFHSLAAFFQQTENSLLGIRDAPERGDYLYKLLDAEEEEVIPAKVPFYRELAEDDEQNLRWRLAKWVTHPENTPFARATVNRIWAIMFGRALVEPVDDIPLEGPFPKALEILADDFVVHDFDLRRLIRIISATEVFQLDSVCQSTSLTTIDSTAHIMTQLSMFGQEIDFVRRFGDPGEDEFEDRGETVTQRLLMLNGRMVDERLEGPLLAPIKLAGLSPNSKKAVEVIYLSTLSRRPTADESRHFAEQLDQVKGRQRTKKAIDIYWTLINSSEFRWNH